MTAPTTGFAYLDEAAGDPGAVLAFAHRGGAYHPEIEGLENTLAAFKHAVSLGYDYLETDVHVTSDGVLLAFHDAVLDRVTDLEGAIADLTFDEVRLALVGGREQVPTLAQLFDEFPRAKFNIDLKADGAVEALAEFIEQREAWDRVLVGSFSPQRMTAFRRRTGGRVPTSAGPVEVVDLPLRPERPPGRLADPAPGRGSADPAQARSLDPGHPRTDPPGPRQRQARARVDRRRARRDARAPRPRGRRAVHRPDRSAQGRAHRARPVEGMSMQETTEFADLGPLNRANEQKAWYWYDWANSAFYTTVLSVLFAPFMITVAGRAAGCGDDADDTCTKTVDVLGLHLAAGSLPFYLTSFATILSAFILPVVGAMVDRSPRKKLHMAGFAWAGAFFCGLLFFMQGDNWQLAAFAIVMSSVLAGCSLVSYYAILVDISTEAERDHVSSRGWAFGYLGGGLLLLVNLGIVLGHDAIGMGTELAVRISLLSAALWWAGFTIIPFLRLRNRAPHPRGGAVRRALPRSFGQLWATLKELRQLPDDADLPAGVRLLQRRHPDRDLRGLDVRLQGAEVRRLRADRDDPADPVRGVRRRALLRSAGRAARRLPGASSGVSSPGW